MTYEDACYLWCDFFCIYKIRESISYCTGRYLLYRSVHWYINIGVLCWFEYRPYQTYFGRTGIYTGFRPKTRYRDRIKSYYIMHGETRNIVDQPSPPQTNLGSLHPSLTPVTTKLAGMKWSWLMSNLRARERERSYLKTWVDDGKKNGLTWERERERAENIWCEEKCIEQIMWKWYYRLERERGAWKFKLCGL